MSDKIRKSRRTCSVVSSIGLKGSARFSEFILQNMLFSRPVEHPRQKAKVILISLPKTTTKMPPLGPAYLKAYLNSKNVSSHSIDFNNRLYSRVGRDNPKLFTFGDATFLDIQVFDRFGKRGFHQMMDAWVDEILGFHPAIVGISVTSHMVYLPLRYMVTALKQRSPRIQIVLGGPACTTDGVDLIRKDYGDVAVKGEGEHAFYEIVRVNGNKRHLRAIKGVIYRDNGAIVDTGYPECIKNLDTLPFPDFDDFLLGQYEYEDVFGIHLTLPIFASRGCIGKCTFCNHAVHWGAYRDRSPRNIFMEMTHQKYRYRSYNFYFCDSTMNVDGEKLEELCDLIIRSKEVFSWSGYFRIFKSESRALYQKMVKAGCQSLFVGVESGSEDVRRDMRKPCSDTLLFQQIRRMHDAGIDLHLGFITGYPTESREDFRRTLLLVEKLKNHVSTITFNVPCALLPGSYLQRNRRKEGIMIDKDGRWFKGENTTEERLKRIQIANRLGLKLGLTRQEDAENKLISMPPNRP
jgi:radical SAM superfamily enzyme YgiQ (UPF0313 family)